jgi:phosphate transport system permease protein
VDVSAASRSLAGPVPALAARRGGGRARRLRSRLAALLAWACVALALLPLGHMLVLVASQGLAALSWRVLTTTSSGTGGGLANAILGTLWLVLLGSAVAVPLGVLGGIYCGETRDGRWVRLVRTSALVLAGVPSIIVGYALFVTLVSGLGWGYSALAGGLALAIIMLPYVLRATDLAVAQVPDELRDASLALGASHPRTVSRVVFRAALPGIGTGVLLALGIAVGETAPLIYTAGWSQYLPTLRLTHAPVGYLTYAVWTFINEPFREANALAYAAALLLMLLVLGLNVAARLTVGRRQPS